MPETKTDIYGASLAVAENELLQLLPQAVAK